MFLQLVTLSIGTVQTELFTCWKSKSMDAVGQLKNHGSHAEDLHIYLCIRLILRSCFRFFWVLYSVKVVLKHSGPCPFQAVTDNTATRIDRPGMVPSPLGAYQQGKAWLLEMGERQLPPKQPGGGLEDQIPLPTQISSQSAQHINTHI